MKLVIRPAARLDIIEARDWLDSKAYGLGHRMLLDLDQAIETIAGNPFLYQIVFGGVRRAPLPTFGYGLFYMASEDEVVVIGFFHGRQNPALLHGRS